MNSLGRIHVSTICRKTGVLTPVESRDNLTVYQGGDAMARMMDPSRDYAIRFVYFEFKNSAPTPPTPAVGDEITLYDALTGDDDYLRVPILAPPSYRVAAAHTAYFAGNNVMFHATTAAAPTDGGGDQVGETNGEILTDGTSVIHTFGIVASEGPKSSDLLFARVSLNSTQTKTAGSDISIHWESTLGPQP